MAHLHLPITLLPTGLLERASGEEDILLGRLRIFLLSAMGEFHRLPFSALRTLWLQLYTMGSASRFSTIIEENQLTILEATIRDDVNAWLEETAVVKQVKILGNEEQENGIQFRTDDREITFKFTYAPRGAGAIGPWNIMEDSRGIF